ncbi:hypothetical protein MNBD_GAMMA12-1153 [hydrothermal vent metagenome]|uniref:Uncharacterized protein n=1 Tax=hydrothermal vent metagenome TaxID=652676 RepID=A0A3B0ZHN3_9ZZZZ
MKNELQEHVDSIANGITNGITLNAEEHDYILAETGQEAGDSMHASEYLSDCLDTEYVVDSSGNYLGARVLVAFGGPNIWIDTRRKIVEGAWWSDNATASFTDSMNLDEYLKEIHACTKA